MVTLCSTLTCSGRSNLRRPSPNVDGLHTSIAIGSDGNPIISHFDETAGALKVLHCNTPNCGTGATATPDTGFVGQHTSIAIGLGGLAWISYYDFGVEALKIYGCGNVACSSGFDVTLDTGGVGQYNSIAILDDGRPIISYLDSPNSNVGIAVCVGLNCPAADLETIGSSDGRWSSVTVGVDGLPVVSFQDTDLRIVHCGDVNCTPGVPGPPLNSTVTITGAEGGDSSITIGVDGNPVVSSLSGSSELSVTVCGSPSCTPFLRRR